MRLPTLIAVAMTACALLWNSAPLAAADAAKLTVDADKPPEEVAEPIRAVLDGKVLRLAAGDKPFFEFWLRKELPLAQKPEAGQLDIGTIPEGTILGVLKVSAERRDFRNEEIPPGVYTLRYGVQPEDGNHLGVAPTRTFALLIPAKADTKLDAIDHKDLMKAAAKINAVKHPSNLNLQSAPDQSGQFPRLTELNDGQHKAILLQFPAHIEGSGEKTTLTFALVYEGTGQT
jgi:hypothetical protein